MRIKPWLCNAIVFALMTTTAAGCFGSGDGGQNACTPVGSSARASQAQPSVMSTAIRASDVSHVPAAFREYSDEGRVTDDAEMGVTVSLALNHEDELDQEIAAVYQPGNPHFHKFMSPDEFRYRYAPTAAQVATAQQYLTAHGVRTADVDANGYLIHARGSATALGEAFGTEIHSYRDRDGTAHYGPASELSIPSDSGIQAVHGLTDSTMHSSARVRSDANSRTVGGGMSPADIRSIYNLPTNLTGSGQKIALVELDGYSASDIQMYASAYGMAMPSLTNVMVDGFNGSPGSEASEVTMDIELAAATAPGAQIMVYEGPNSTQTLIDIFSRIASDNSASQISVSWGVPESQVSTSFLQSENSVLKQLAVQGQAVFAATGDNGAYDDGSTVSLQDPASEPFVVAVGGTHLDSIGSGYGGESTWNNGSPSAGAGGGGVSAVWSQPSWQNVISTGQNLGSSSMRNVPDVSLNADPNTGYAIAVGGSWSVYGGTSAATPIWAGFLALVNQNRANNHVAAIGFPNPAIYSIGAGSRYSTDFHDINDGSTNLHFPAVTGFDDATGWGSFNGQELLQDLTTEPTTSSDQLGC